MNALVLGAMGLLMAGAAVAQGYNQSQGYIRRDGTYVAPHYRTNPDGNRFNNWSSQPNVNPFTGQQGRVNPYAIPAPRPPALNSNPYGSSYGTRRF